MKTRKRMKRGAVVAMLLWMGSTLSVMAQQSIDKLTEKLEKNDEVSVTSIVKRSEDGKTITRTTKIFEFDSSNKDLIEDIEEAFEKEEPKAITSSKFRSAKRNKGKMSSNLRTTSDSEFYIVQSAGDKDEYILKFEDKKTKSTYTFSVGETKASLFIIKRTKDKDEDNSSFIDLSDLELQMGETVKVFTD